MSSLRRKYEVYGLNDIFPFRVVYYRCLAPSSSDARDDNILLGDATANRSLP